LIIEVPYVKNYIPSNGGIGISPGGQRVGTLGPSRAEMNRTLGIENLFPKNDWLGRISR